MDKGIRSGMVSEFNKRLDTLSETGGKVFRKHLIFWAVEQYGCTVNAACTHYNHAKNEAAKIPALAEKMAGLGRAPEKNNGGRKRKTAVAEAIPSVIPTPVGSLLQNFLTALTLTTPATEVDEEAALAETHAALLEHNDTEQVREEVEFDWTQEEGPEGLFPEQSEFKVCKKSDGTVVAEGLSFEAAKQLVNAAAAAKKAKLYWV